MSYPRIIQGGMGAGVSGWQLARAVSKLGGLGVVSSTALDSILARRLQLGDPGGHLRQALAAFPFPAISERALAAWFVEGGKSPDAPFKLPPNFTATPSRELVELTVLANFAEIFLAKENHTGLVGINLLSKIQLPTLPSLFGAMLAGVDDVMMGAGIPRAIPGILDALALGEPVRLKLDVEDASPGAEFFTDFSPAAFCEGEPPALRRPKFLAIISSATLAITLARKSTGRVDGFVVENSRAGGHNAPPRGLRKLDEGGEPIYGERDAADLPKIAALGLPFWLAGSFGRTGGLDEARKLGAIGIQTGTPFAFCAESGIEDELKHRVLDGVRTGTVAVFTDPQASPTGFPFKIVQIKKPASAVIPAERKRLCDLGYLRRIYQKPGGDLGYRCPGEAVENFCRRGGTREETVGRQCVCNGLLATIGLGQLRADSAIEPPLLTAGDCLQEIGKFLPPGATSYRASDVIDRLLAS